MSTFKLPQTAFALALLASAWPMANAARAADLDPGYADVPAPITQQQLTFGSGWYVRGDIAGTTLPDVSLNGGSGTAPPNVSLRNGGQIGYAASLGAGYSFNEWFRADVTADFNQPIHVVKSGGYFAPSTKTCIAGVGLSGAFYEGCSNEYEAKISRYNVLVNGYIDLGHWWRVIPYIGAGMGLGFGHYSTSSTYLQSDGTPYDIYFTNLLTNVETHGNRDVSSSSNYYNFAFAAMAGVAIDVADHTKLDVGYRYLNVGRILNSSLTSHQIRVGLRYMIDN